MYRTKVYYGLQREPDITAFVDNIIDDEEEETQTTGEFYNKIFVFSGMGWLIFSLFNWLT